MQGPQRRALVVNQPGSGPPPPPCPSRHTQPPGGTALRDVGVACCRTHPTLSGTPLQVLEAKAIKKAGPKDDEVRLVEHRRAHNILIELSGIRKPFDEIKVGLGWLACTWSPFGQTQICWGQLARPQAAGLDSDANGEQNHARNARGP